MHKIENHFLNVVAKACGVFAALTGLVAVLGWLTGHPVLAGFGSPVPMAPSTALFFIFYGSAVFLRVRYPQSSTSYLSGMSIGLLLAALLLFALSYLGIHLRAEHFGIPISGTAGGVPIGHISPGFGGTTGDILTSGSYSCGSTGHHHGGGFQQSLYMGE